MTLKIYKKRTRWYFKYRDVEYQLNIKQALDIFENNLQKDKVLYVKLGFSNMCSGMTLVGWTDNTFYFSQTLEVTLNLLSEKGHDGELLEISKEMARLIHHRCINILDIY